MTNLSQLLAPTRTLVSTVGDFIRKESKNFQITDIEHKGFNDLVSYVDKEAERKLVAGCRKILPEAGFVTEEGTATTKKEEFNWIIDPLDGTTNFTHGLPIYAISLALMHRDKVVMGIVLEINHDECFYALEGTGAFCNDARISISSVRGLDGSLLATGFPYYNFEDMNRYLQILNDLMQKTHGLRRMGSAAVDLAYVACGRFEGFFEYNLNAWDVAAGALIVQEAGGTVSDFTGKQDYLFGRQIIAAGHVHEELFHVIHKHWK